MYLRRNIIFRQSADNNNDISYENIIMKKGGETLLLCLLVLD